MDTALIAVLVGAAAAALTTWLLDIRRDREAERRRELESRALRLAEFLGATHQGALSIGLLAAKRLGDEKDLFLTGQFYTESETRESTALNAIQLLDPEDVVKACLRLHAALVALEKDALGRQWSTGEWSVRRAAVGHWVDTVLCTALKSLGRPYVDRSRYWDEAAADVRSSHVLPAQNSAP